MKCEGCKDEMLECYKWQEKGYDAGLRWKKEHCLVFVFNREGELIVE